MSFNLASGVIGGGYGNYVTFDGSNDYVQRSAGLTGAADGKAFTLSVWLKATAGGTVQRQIIDINGGKLDISVNDTSSPFSIEMYAYNSAGTRILDGKATAAISEATECHLQIGVDLTNASNRYIYINGSAASVSWTIYTNDNIYFGGSNPATVGGRSAGGDKFYGQLFRLWFDTTYIAAGGAEFRTSGGVSANLGGNGSVPTGSIPLVYLDGSPAGWQNRGSGGDFTITGTLTAGDAAPVG